MRIKLLVLIVSMLVFSCSEPAEPDVEQDIKSIRALFVGLSDAWKSGDATAWGNAFVADADVTLWYGRHLKGRDAITATQESLLSDPYAGTEIALEVKKIRLVSDESAVVHIAASVFDKGVEPPAEHHAVSLAVIIRKQKGWQIAALQDAPYAARQMRANADLRVFKKSLTKSPAVEEAAGVKESKDGPGGE